MQNKFLEIESKKEYFKNMMGFLDKEYETKSILPPKKDMFNAFNLTDLENIKVVIIGQDPYPTKGVAHGLAFSVKKGVKIPASLKNIFKELEDENIGFKIPEDGCLEPWAKQGVFLINTVLTVEEGKPNSHKNIGWQTFTTNLIKYLNSENKNICYMLWGNNAQKYEKYIDGEKNLILKSVHPSPLSYYRGFLGCKHFLKANEYLKNNNIEEINWNLE